MERRDVLKCAAILAVWSGLRRSQAESAETDQPLAASSGQKTGQPLLELRPAPVEIRKGNMLYRTLGRTGERNVERRRNLYRFRRDRHEGQGQPLGQDRDFDHG